jgi:hypothetical protein
MKKTLLPLLALAMVCCTPQRQENQLITITTDDATDRKMTLLSMGLIHADESGRLPLYRYCHDLINGTVATEKSASEKSGASPANSRNAVSSEIILRSKSIFPSSPSRKSRRKSNHNEASEL